MLRNQIEEWDLPEDENLPRDQNLKGDDIRQVLAALINPACDRYSAEDLGKATGLPEKKVRDTLTFCKADAAKGQRFEVWPAPWNKNGQEAYALTKLTSWPNRIKGQAILIAERIGAWLTKPKVDAPGV